MRSAGSAIRDPDGLFRGLAPAGDPNIGVVRAVRGSQRDADAGQASRAHMLPAGCEIDDMQCAAPLQRDRSQTRRRVAHKPDRDGSNRSDHVYDSDVAATGEERETDSGIEIKPVYTADDAPEQLELPGEFPFTRGPYADMYRGRPWTIRQYAGFASAEETNQRFRYLLDRGQTGLSVAFDLPTQLGYDSDDPRAAGEVGRTGVSIDSIADMELLFDGIPLAEVSTSMTINAPAALLLLLYELVAEEQGVKGDVLRGTVQNDVLKEYIARGNYIFPPRPSMRITTDLFAYCAERIPRWNTISISGYHIREAGSTAVQELAFTLANGIAYCQAAVDAGLSPNDFGVRLSFFFNAHNHFFQEVAKFRAARRLWARIMRERFGATNPKAWALRFHAQTGGSTLTAQQPDNNVVRVAVQALSAVCGGAQSIHTNGYDEALALPSERAARIALRTQQLLAHEAGGTDTADPLGGSYFVESLTDELEAKASELIERVDELGGAVAAIEQGFVQNEIEQAAFRWQQEVEAGERVIVGVNRFMEGDEEPIELHRLDPAAERRQLERTARIRAERSAEEVDTAMAAVVAAARSDANLLVPMREALRARCTIGEICNALRDEFGMYDAQR
jgi:methylmalonyl-CoA mutase, N-terminal domain